MWEDYVVCIWGVQYEYLHRWVVFSIVYWRLYIRCFWRGMFCVLKTLHMPGVANVFPCPS